MILLEYKYEESLFLIVHDCLGKEKIRNGNNQYNYFETALLDIFEGSMLGPIVFKLFINDLILNIK